MRAALVGLGDLGRSPRLLYHALALADAGASVDLVGYTDSTLPGEVATHVGIRIHPVGGRSTSPVADARRQPFVWSAGWRAGAQLVRLVRILMFTLPRPDVVLAQNPPGLPTLLVAWVAARLRGGRLVIDWHNPTSAMLALRLGPTHALVRVVDWCEGALGRRADGHLFVSAAMAAALAHRWQLTGAVFRDRPAAGFVPLAPDERARLRRSVLDGIGCADAEDRVLLIVGPSSWTHDEDHDLLLEAIASLTPSHLSSHRRLVILMTGLGPRRAAFEAELTRRSHEWPVVVRTAWFEPDRYRRVVAAADAGLCLHRSASGFDLPMKVSDLFGAGVPVCALDYGPCLAELVEHEQNGLLFETAADLARAFVRLSQAPEVEPDLLERLRCGAAAAGAVGWAVAWQAEARPVLMPTRGASSR